MTSNSTELNPIKYKIYRASYQCEYELRVIKFEEIKHTATG